jgi:hypothetical protein
MTTILLILGIAALAVLGYGVVLVLRGDSYGPRRNPPESHYPDPFDPRSRGRLA